jgi:hypothetical protein
VGLSYNTIKWILKEIDRSLALKIPRPGDGPRVMTEAKARQIITLRKSGASYYYIAKITGVSPVTAMSICRRAKLPRRIFLVYMAGHDFGRAHGICKVEGCGHKDDGRGFCWWHRRPLRKGHVDKNGPAHSAKMPRMWN